MKQLRRSLCVLLALVMVLSLGMGAAPRAKDAAEPPVLEDELPVVPVEETPAEEAPAEEAPAEEAPAEEAPAEEAPAEETPAEEAPAEEAPAEEAPAEETPAEETPAEEAPAEEAPAEEAPAEEAPAEEAPAEEAPAEEAPAEEAPVEEALPEEEPAEEAEPEEVLPAQAFNYRTSDGTEISVDAPEGAFPEGTRMEIKEVKLEDVQKLIDEDKDDEFEGTVVAAVDISFYNGEEKVQPKKDVRVSYTSPAAAAVSNPRIIHISDADELDEIENVKAEAADPVRGTMRAMSGAGANAAKNETERVKLSFDAKSFSTYAIVWNEADEGGTLTEVSATIHWGYMDGDTFTEFTDTASLDSDAGTMNLNVIFDGYMFSAATYVKGEVEYAIDSPILTKVTAEDGSTSWTMTAHVTTGETGSPETVTIESGADIYVYYVEKSSGYTPPSPAPADVKGPVTEKAVSSNGDGTYKIHLDVTGQVDHTETRIGANVIIIMDRTQSMSNTISGSTTRMAAAKTALNTLISTLNPGTGSGQNLINFTAVDFANSASFVNGINWTSTRSEMESYVTNLTDWGWNHNPDGYGTCWQAGLYGGIVRARSVANDENLSKNKTYIIFLTDGNPNGWYTNANSDGGPTNNPGYQQQGAGTFVQAAYNAAIPNAINASALCGNNLYGIFCGSTSDAVNLQNLMNYSGTQGTVNGHYINGTSEDAIINAFKNIAQTIVNDIGSSNVGVDDGIPTLADVSAAVSGSAGGFEYYITYPLTLITDQSDAHYNQYTYTHGGTDYYVASSELSGAKDRNAESYAFGTGYTYATEGGTTTYYYTMVWDGAPSAGYSSSNGVTWNLESEKVLADKTIYSLEFDVWPSQDAYDLLANLNNQMEGWTLDALDDATLEQLVVTVSGTQYEYTVGAAEGAGTWAPKSGSPSYTTTQFLNVINQAQTVEYNLLTNTHLFTTYKYGDTTFTDPPASGLVSGAMLLEDEWISLVKYWHNDLDAREASDQTMPLTVTKDEEPYLDVLMAKPQKVDPTDPDCHEWVQYPATADQVIYISCGVMTVDGSNNLTLKTTGHDYTVIEPDDLAYYWDLTADIYHPMVINGTNTMLILVTDEAKAAADFPAAMNELANNKRAQGSDGFWYYKFDDKLYVDKHADVNVLQADNDRRSNLRIEKIVTGTGAPEDALFTYKVTMENKYAPYQGDTGYSSDYDTFWFVVVKNPNLDVIERLSSTDIAWAGENGDGLVVSGATAEVRNGAETGYYWFDNVEGGKTVTISIKAGWRICFTSVARYTDYTVKELDGEDMPEGFVFDKVEATAECEKTGETATAAVVDANDGMKVAGSFDNSNSNYRVNYTNKYAGYFYIYHSSDCSVERIPIAVDGVALQSFDIFAKTMEGTLYGGYYSDYAGKSSTFDAAKLDYSGSTNPKDDVGTEDGQAKTYSLAYIKDSGLAAWSSEDALTVSGLAMVPEQDAVYFLKEVPTEYLMPYTYYTYYKSNNKIADMWAISALDDLNYSDAGFYVKNVKTGATSVVSSLSIKAENSTTTVKLTAYKLFIKSGMKDGYLSYVKTTDTSLGSKVLIWQYWTTLDGIMVYGIGNRTVDTSGDYGYKGMIQYEEGTQDPFSPYPETPSEP